MVSQVDKHRDRQADSHKDGKSETKQTDRHAQIDTDLLK